MMKKMIRFPMYNGGGYKCMEDVVRACKDETWNRLSLYICDIVEYNVKYRDCLRKDGIEGLIDRLCSEAPSFKNETDAIKCLRKWYSELGRLADYDIQCYGIKETFEVLGRKIQGLQEMRRRVEMYAGENWGELNIFTPDKKTDSSDGLHIGMMFMDYPKFDSSDACDDRSYDNYIIRKRKITNTDMNRLFKVPSCSNAMRIHETIPTELLPVLYYGGSEDYMLLASCKM